jgi:hypothetical protein
MAKPRRLVLENDRSVSAIANVRALKKGRKREARFVRRSAVGWIDRSLSEQLGIGWVRVDDGHHGAGRQQRFRVREVEVAPSS